MESLFGAYPDSEYTCSKCVTARAHKTIEKTLDKVFGEKI
jgi:hypothetical protein